MEIPAMPSRHADTVKLTYCDSSISRNNAMVNHLVKRCLEDVAEDWSECLTRQIPRHVYYKHYTTRFITHNRLPLTVIISSSIEVNIQCI
ncbi:hypothetical protein CDAR_438561 [Caerostris darwini]|uniref:Uncharacterized protein n=1 Tax=Caerostris darwini TaxID=1538125 RepID=A0AAV4X0X6_9ARAC|nr:hypothetical protein CDAR_438561 [Caerostris darwini]